MSDGDDLSALVWGFLGISLLSVGGGVAALPEMHRLMVETHGWMDDLAFSKRYALAQAAPGPNVMVVGLFGWHVAGITGMFAAMLAMCGPTSILAYAFCRLRGRLQGALAMRVFERGMVPIAVGLIAASGLLLAQGAAFGTGGTPLAIAISIASTLFVWRSRFSPLWVLGAGAAIGALFLH
ncbi:chromate transporter [Roseococcus sp. SDR]|uniref:chromate transporter n=1 Tax=Roseococcus sp. SDR TaxID=2835532 RepID=UPI001BCE42CA|nr:chromate transporter [Roseococcus sp. SDR]MBS7788719.1 chromate transporter [Roseococcus sp. SDR]MBV1844033.1 chromate transporter [Roseococcus sp. SDR]